jgi:hypothetical protein
VCEECFFLQNLIFKNGVFSLRGNIPFIAKLFLLFLRDKTHKITTTFFVDNNQVILLLSVPRFRSLLTFHLLFTFFHLPAWPDVPS